MSVEALRSGPVAAAIRRHRLVVVLRNVAPGDALHALVAELADAGARVFEVSVDTPTGAADLPAVRERLQGRGDGPFLVGAGTVLRRHDLEAARRAGADFAAAQVLDLPLVSTAVEEGLPFIPGAFTPTEIAAAWAAGATFVKLFPASAAGRAIVRDLRGPMPEVELIPSGGIDLSNASSFLEAGAAAVAVGAAITRADWPARRALLASIARSRAGA